MEYLDAKVPREVPVAWFGVASEVRLMGSFDGWTRGVDLSADDISDSVFTRFEATVLLLPVPSLQLLPLTPGAGDFAIMTEIPCCAARHSLQAGPKMQGHHHNNVLDKIPGLLCSGTQQPGCVALGLGIPCVLVDWVHNNFLEESVVLILNLPQPARVSCIQLRWVCLAG